MSERTLSPSSPARMIRARNEAEWQTALGALPVTHPLQSWAWGRFKSNWGWQANPLALAEDGLDQATAAALVLKRQLPRLPLAMLYAPKGPLLDYDDAALTEQVLEELEQFTRSQRAIFLTIDPDVPLFFGLDPSTAVPAGERWQALLRRREWRVATSQIQFRNTVKLDLDRPEDEILASMRQKTRYNIRLAARKDVQIRTGSRDDWPIIAGMYQETAARDEFAIRPAAYYLDAWRHFDNAGMLHVLIAEYRGAPLGAVLLVRQGATAIYMYGASTNVERKRMPNYLLQWEAIRWSKENGCKWYDFWGAPDVFDESDRMWGVWRFKAGFEGVVAGHIGAWDFVARPFWYWTYHTVLPRYLSFLRGRGGNGV